MRCPDCNKFVSMDLGDLEIHDAMVELNNTAIEITFNIRLPKVCIDCGGELKEANCGIETTVEVEDAKEFQALNEAARENILKALPEYEIDVMEIDTSAEQVAAHSNVTIDFEVKIPGLTLRDKCTHSLCTSDFEEI